MVVKVQSPRLGADLHVLLGTTVEGCDFADTRCLPDLEVDRLVPADIPVDPTGTGRTGHSPHLGSDSFQVLADETDQIAVDSADTADHPSSNQMAPTAAIERCASSRVRDQIAARSWRR